jgi:hypothetical protein
MASWAAIAAKATQPTVSVQDLTRSTENLVVDANAIIGGVRLDGIADRAVTVQEVLDEVRDKQSRQFLASLPFTIDVAEPTDESMAAGGCDVPGWVRGQLQTGLPFLKQQQGSQPTTPAVLNLAHPAACSHALCT